MKSKKSVQLGIVALVLGMALTGLSALAHDMSDVGDIRGEILDRDYRDQQNKARKVRRQIQMRNPAQESSGSCANAQEGAKEKGACAR